jgi:hypothetical protein
VTLFKKFRALCAFTTAMNELPIQSLCAALTALALAGACGCAGDAVKLGTVPGQSASPNYERFALARETTVNVSEPTHVEPNVVTSAASSDFAYRNLVVLLPDARLATAQLRALGPSGRVTPSVHVGLLDSNGTELASMDYQVPGVSLGLMSYAKLFGGYDEGLWLALLGNTAARFTRFDSDLHVSREIALPAAEVQDIYEPIDSYLQVGTEVPLPSSATLPTTSDCARLLTDADMAPRLRTRVWTDDGLWIMGCSSPRKGLPNALAKPALYQCSRDGTLLRAVVLDVLAKSDTCFATATVRDGLVIGAIYLDDLTIVRVDMAQGVFGAQHLHTQSPPLTQAAIDPGDGSVALNARLGLGRFTLGTNAEVLLSARGSLQGSETDILCLAPADDRASCVRTGQFDSVFSSIALSEELRAYVFTRKGELWRVAFPEDAR